MRMAVLDVYYALIQVADTKEYDKSSNIIDTIFNYEKHRLKTDNGKNEIKANSEAINQLMTYLGMDVGQARLEQVRLSQVKLG